MNSVFEIPNNLFDYEPMISRWVVYELRELVYYKIDVMLSEVEVLHRTNDPT